MMNWAKQQLANVAGIQEPIYGPSAIKSVAEQDVPYTELQREDLRWAVMQSTCVETQTFYLMADGGHVGMAQVIYSNVAGIRTTCQFNTKVFYPRSVKQAPTSSTTSATGDHPHQQQRALLWCSDPLENHSFDEEGVSFFADNVAVTLSDDGHSYTIKSAVNEKSLVNLKVTRTAPGFQVGRDGTSYYGTDLTQPWGRMRHAFWPRCVVEGSVITPEEELDFKGRAFFVHALQGMKPHHAAAKWNFVNFQSPTYSAVMMDYVTPPSYDSTVVNVGGLAQDDAIITAGPTNVAVHTEVRGDPENDWPEPADVRFEWRGKTKDGKQEVEARLEGSLGERLDRVDVMAEVPAFVKKIVGGVAGTKPYIYQYAVPMTLRLKIGDGEEISEQGNLFAEATFIS
ncbi:MAG: putative cell survival pathways protein [Peltula sp. TS41687]|nr:MAG: putative cell survival pathways protein [Peltula sp. TS41687]